jgi:hypothetical protein
MTPFSCLPLEGKVLSECEADEVNGPMPLIRQPFGLPPSPGGRRQEWGRRLDATAKISFQFKAFFLLFPNTAY